MPDDEESSRRNITIALVLVLIAILVIGGGTVLVGRALPGNNVQQAIPTTSATSPPIGVPGNNGSGSIGCGTDISCFISAARSCNPASVEWTSTMNILGVFNQATRARLALQESNSIGTCSFSDRIDDVKVSATDQAAAAARARGLTDSQIQNQISATQTQLRQTIGITTNCTFTTSYLVTMLTNWSKGVFSSKDLAPGQCTATAANGANVPLYTNGSIRLPPNPQRTGISGGRSTVPTQTGNTSAGMTTMYLYPNHNATDGNDHLSFQVSQLTADEVGVTITDTITGASKLSHLTLHTPLAIFGHTLTVIGIEPFTAGHINGNPIIQFQPEITIHTIQ